MPIVPMASVWANVRKAVKSQKFRFGLLVLIPTLAWYVIFSYLPIGRSFWMAVVDYKLLQPSESEFVGLDNFVRLFKYDLFWTSVGNTLRYAVSQYVMMVPLAMIVSYCLANVLRGRKFYQFVVFLPVVVSMVAISLLFYAILEPGVGMVNYVLKSLGLPTSRWLTGPESALNTCVAIATWQGLGFYVVLLTAGFLNIPGEMYDASKVDGANAWQNFWRITIPLMSHTLTLVSVLLLMGAVQVYTSIAVMTRGGPGSSTYVINLLVVSEAFTNMRFGFATAAAFSLFILILLVTVLQIRLTRVGWQY